MQTTPAVSDADVDVDGAHALRANEARASTAHAEIDRLLGELHALVSRGDPSGRAVQAALPAAVKLKIVTANVDACIPSRRPGLAAELVALADQRLKSRRDAVER